MISIIGLNMSGQDASNGILKMSPVNKFLTGSSYGIESSIITTVIFIIILIVLLITNKSVRLTSYNNKEN